jgi:hypothetical protein
MPAIDNGNSQNDRIGIVTEDPLAQVPIGTSIQMAPVLFDGATATVVPQGVVNWTFFEGAVLAVVVRTGNEDLVAGTAVVIAPGLAVTATHVLSDRLVEVLAGTASLTCIGPTSAGLEIWRVQKINYCDADDIAYLSLQLASAISPEWRFRSIAVTTRAPKPGETVFVLGFKFPTMVRSSWDNIRAEGTLYAAAGEVTNVYHPIRDRVLMPYPTIEVACGSLGGMSGGAVLDGQGYLLGVLSRGWDTEDQAGPSYAAWIIGGLNRHVQIPWPPGFYTQPTHVLQIDERVLRIEGRERIAILDDTTYEYRVWFDR